VIFAIALLAAWYAYQSKKQPKLRLKLKSRLFELARSKKMPFDKILKLLIFVRDFVNLPQTFENEFRETQYYLTFPLELVWNFFKLKINSLWFWINKNQGVYRDK
jgi:hypothetical protein